METKINLAKAVISVMKAVKSIDKSMTVGQGNYAYKAVSDKDVKEAIGKEMEANGLCILPIGVEAKTQIDRWEEGSKQKQSVLTEVTTKYLLLHESGESMELAGYGHGIDSQDKAAGKATTYALKYALLYTFMVATGKLDDADIEPNENKQVAPVALPELLPGTPQWLKAVEFLKQGVALEDIKASCKLTLDNEQELINQSKI